MYTTSIRISFQESPLQLHLLQYCTFVRVLFSKFKIKILNTEEKVAPALTSARPQEASRTCGPQVPYSPPPPVQSMHAASLPDLEHPPESLGDMSFSEKSLAGLGRMTAEAAQVRKRFGSH